METNQYMDMFLDESHEHLQSLNDGLLVLDVTPQVFPRDSQIIVVFVHASVPPSTNRLFLVPGAHGPPLRECYFIRMVVLPSPMSYWGSFP